VTATKSTPLQLITWVLILFPVLLYLSYGYRYSGPVFWGDDFDLLETVTLSPEATSLGQKLHLWTKQQNEHRVIVPRLITFLDYTVEGFIHWKTLILIANLIWVCILYFFWSAFRTLKLPAWMFIPVPWFLFQPQYYENHIWATSILQQSNVVFWLAFTVFAYARGYRKAALLPAVLATFSHGSGLSSFLVILFLVILERRWRLLPYWLVSSAVVMGLYFYQLEKGQSANFSESISNPVQLIGAFFAFSGSLTRVIVASPLAAVGTGFLMMMVLGSFVLPKLWKAIKSPRYKPRFFTVTLTGNLAFFVISAALVAISRSWAGLEAIMPPRYQHYTVFLLGWTYLVILRYLSERNSVRPAALLFVAGGILFNVLSYIVYTPMVSFRNDYLTADETNYLNHGQFLQYHWTFNRNIRETYRKALDKGVIRMERQMPEIGDTTYPVDSAAALSFRVDKAPVVSNSNPAEEMLWLEGKFSSGKSLFVYLQPAQDSGYWIPLRGSRPAFRDLFLRGKTRGDAYHSELYYANLPAGEYRVGILKDGQFSWTLHTLNVQPE